MSMLRFWRLWARMHKKKGTPKRNELVICTPTKILPHAVFVKLKEYEDVEGMIHISQISSKWVKNVATFFQMGKDVVCKVLFIKPEGIDLSLKAVNPSEKNKKWNEWKAEVRTENMLTNAAKKLGKTKEQMYEEIGNKIIEEYDNLYIFIDAYRMDGEEVFESLKIPKKWVEVITPYAKEKEKNVRLSLKVQLQTFKPNGIELIKNILLKIKKKNTTIKYISSPEYLIELESTDYKQAQKDLQNMQKQLESDANKNGVKLSIAKK